MTRDKKNHISYLQSKVNKPKGELIAILEELEEMSETKTKAAKLEKIIIRLEKWQNNY